MEPEVTKELNKLMDDAGILYELDGLEMILLNLFISQAIRALQGVPKDLKIKVLKATAHFIEEAYDKLEELNKV